MRHKIAGILFLILGVYFLNNDMGHMNHGPSLFGIGEMSWMWFTMAVVHLLIRDCNCPKCKG
jgi:hypothetical protein